MKLLADLRNSAIHLGEVVEEERKEIFHAFLAASCLIVDEMGADRKEFFGEFVELVATHLDKSVAEVNRAVAEKIARAKSDYERKYGGLDPVHRQGIIESVESGYSPEKYEEELADCPACKNQGMLSGNYDVDWEVDFDDDGTPVGGYPLVTLTPSTFQCSLCGLLVNGGAELKAAGLGGPIQIEDVDPSDFYDEPDY